ncbi:MAG: hypothetical protein KAH01_05400 [Caldisericia bacterium]|nr:hypothetical protein [Caldisericia bacterium]
MNESDTGSKIKSELPGFCNIGKFHKHFRQNKRDTKPIDYLIYMILVEYSFGYTKDIRYEIKISIRQLMDETRSGNKTVITSLKKLQDLNFITRKEWKDFGPKQAYEYQVVMPKDYHIEHKPKENKTTKNIQYVKKKKHDPNAEYI